MTPQRRHELTDDQWERLAPLLPPQRSRTERPANDHRTVLNGMLWVLRTGAPWRDLPERSGSWNTVASRYRRWQLAGLCDQILRTLQEVAHDDTLDGSLTMIDGSNVRDHQHAAGARKSGRRSCSRPQSRGWGSKLHLVTERSGKPIVAEVTAGQRHESPQAIPLLEQATERMWPDAVAGEKGYSASDLRNWLQAREIDAAIPYRADEGGDHAYDEEAYAECIARLASVPQSR